MVKTPDVIDRQAMGNTSFVHHLYIFVNTVPYLVRSCKFLYIEPPFCINELIQFLKYVTICSAQFLEDCFL